MVHASDSHGNPITDYSVEIIVIEAGGSATPVHNFEADVHPYLADTSYRCFHVQLDTLPPLAGRRLIARIIASSGTELVGYQGFGSNVAAPNFGPFDLDLTEYDGTKPGKPALFYAFTTTLLEIILNREPVPPVNIFQWLP